MPEIRLEDISFDYGKKKVLESVDMQIDSEKFTCLLGATGSGKTTLLRLIAGLETPDNGKIFIAGEPVSDGKRILVQPSKRKIGFVFQDLALWPHFTVFKNVFWPLQLLVPKKMAQTRTKEMLDDFGLSEHHKKYPHQLSGGQQQQLAMARALATYPQILLLDEPIANLDADLKEQAIQNILRVKNQFNVTIVYVTHDHKEAARLADAIIELKKKNTP